MSAVDQTRVMNVANALYAVGLAERVRLVACPRCGALQDEWCRGAHRGHRTKGSHYARHEAAKFAGFLMGRRSEGDLAKVRQLHHELVYVATTTRYAR